MQKKILSAVLSLCLVGAASVAFADDDYDVDIDVEINKSFEKHINVEVNKSMDNDLIEVNNDDGNVLSQASNITTLPGRSGNQVPTRILPGDYGLGGGVNAYQTSMGNVAAQANAEIDGSLLAVGNSMSLTFDDSFNHTRSMTKTLDLDVDVDIDDSFNIDDSFKSRTFVIKPCGQCN